MAKIRTIAPVGQIRGSIGGSTYSQNRYGVYIRTRSIPTVVHTEYTENIRNAFTAATKAWRNLDAEQKSAWALYAENNKVYDNFGEQQVLTGHGMFVKTNTLLKALVNKINLLPPGKAAPSAVPAYTLEVTNDTVGKTSSFAITFDNPWGDLYPDHALYVSIAVVDSFGRRIQTNMWKYLSLEALQGIDSRVLLNSSLIARGLQHIEGSVLWVRLRIYNYKEGTWGPWDAGESPEKILYPILVPEP